MKKRILNSEVWEYRRLFWADGKPQNKRFWRNIKTREEIPFSAAIAMSPQLAVEHDAHLENVAHLTSSKEAGLFNNREYESWLADAYHDEVAISQNALALTQRIGGRE